MHIGFTPSVYLHGNQILWVCLLMLVGCAGSSELSGPYDGISSARERDKFSFDARVSPIINSEIRGLVVDVAISETSITFEERNDSLHAHLEWLIRLYSADKSRLFDERSARTSFVRPVRALPSLFNLSRHQVVFAARAGKYLVEIQLEDRLSGKTSTRTLIAQFPAQNTALTVSELSLDSETNTPLLDIHVPFRAESTSVSFTMAGNVSRPVRTTIGLLKIQADTVAARPPYWRGPPSTAATVTGRRIVVDTVSVISEVVLRGTAEIVSTMFKIVEPGAYQFVLSVDNLAVEGGPPAVNVDRYLVVRRARYPGVTTYTELSAPLFYLAEPEEWEAIKVGVEPGQMVNDFDSFWGRFMTDERRAKQTLRLYFSRVEEANVRFGGLSEGWRSDLGMVYIILGEPLFIDRSRERETWFYSFEDGRADQSFTFVTNLRSDFPALLKPVVLERSSDYENFWRNEIRRWRRGDVTLF